VERIPDTDRSPVSDTPHPKSDGQRSFIVETVSESGLSSYDISPDNSTNFECGQLSTHTPSPTVHRRPSDLPVSSSETSSAFPVHPNDLQKVDGAIGMMLYSMIQVLKNPKMSELVSELEKKYGSPSADSSPVPTSTHNPNFRSTSCPPHLTQITHNSLEANTDPKRLQLEQQFKEECLKLEDKYQKLLSEHEARRGSS
jgi:hypothetical protein